jgi:hypothetical protein
MPDNLEIYKVVGIVRIHGRGPQMWGIWGLSIASQSGLAPPQNTSVNTGHINIGETPTATRAPSPQPSGLTALFTPHSLLPLCLSIGRISLLPFLFRLHVYYLPNNANSMIFFIPAPRTPSSQLSRVRTTHTTSSIRHTTHRI